MNCVYLCSRDWSYKILKELISKEACLNIKLIVCLKDFKEKFEFHDFPSIKTIIIDNYGDLKEIQPEINDIDPDAILCFGWSGYIPISLFQKYPCLILHPSRLPLFRGGSPIQNQIIAGIEKSSVSIIYADETIDSGAVLYQSTLPLNGSLKEIKELIAFHGIAGISFISQYFSMYKRFYSIDQDPSSATIYKRRSPSMSQITFEDLANNEAKVIADKVRCLQDEYPKAFLKCKNNTNLILSHVLYD